MSSEDFPVCDCSGLDPIVTSGLTFNRTELGALGMLMNFILRERVEGEINAQAQMFSKRIKAIL